MIHKEPSNHIRTWIHILLANGQSTTGLLQHITIIIYIQYKHAKSAYQLNQRDQPYATNTHGLRVYLNKIHAYVSSMNTSIKSNPK